MDKPEVIASTTNALCEHLHPDIVVRHVLLVPSYPAIHKAKRDLEALLVKPDPPDAGPRTQIDPPHATPGAPVTLKDYLRIRNEGRPLPTSECFCDSCEEYEEFMKAVKISLPDEMAQKKEVRRINAIAQDVMVKILGGREVDVETGRDAEIKEMVVGVVECRICRAGRISE